MSSLIATLGALLAALGIAWASGRRAARDKRRMDDAEAYRDARQRMDAVGTDGDADDARRRLRARDPDQR